jgi:hypothetical protein
VALDVHDLADYLEAGWIANAIYRPKSELCGMFPRLTTEQSKNAGIYKQKRHTKSDDSIAVTAEDAERFTRESSGAESDAVEFAKILEFWDRRDNLIKTVVEGVKVWAKEPYSPPQASTRFYPYFELAFYETDGTRHPQSLAWRLRKLQDEYADTRSAFRTNRRRSITGVMFNAEQLDPDNAAKLEKGTIQEFIGLKLTNPNMDMNQVFREKPIARMDPMVFDTSIIMSDMEKISGVQEALQASVQQPKTATEAEIQQSGFAARATSYRDVEEDMLNDIAQYCAEIAVQSITVEEAQRIAGPAAFWPVGIDIEDLLTMVEVDITAGSTGKPNTSAERQAWSVVMPMIQQLMVQIQQMRQAGNEPLAKALTELLRETLTRMGDRADVERFLPEGGGAPMGQAMPPGMAGAGPIPPAESVPPEGVPGNGAAGAQLPSGPEQLSPGPSAAAMQ